MATRTKAKADPTLSGCDTPGKEGPPGVAGAPGTIEPTIPEYALEPLTDDITMQLNVWGNSTMMCRNKLADIAPGWALMISDIFVVIGDTLKGMKE
jgi:hypothetical protein